jgi:thioesterase domain-containing protein
MDVSEYPGLTIDPDLGWRRFMLGKLQIIDMQGNHLGILRPPNVYKLAAVIRARVLAATG